MATVRIPVRTDLLNYRFPVELDGAFYTLGLRWNPRDAHWFLDVLQAGAAAVLGAKVVHSDDLLQQYGHMAADGRLPPGRFRVVDVTGATRDPDTGTFGREVVFLYEESE